MGAGERYCSTGGAEEVTRGSEAARGTAHVGRPRSEAAHGCNGVAPCITSSMLGLRPAQVVVLHTASGRAATSEILKMNAIASAHSEGLMEVRGAGVCAWLFIHPETQPLRSVLALASL